MRKRNFGVDFLHHHPKMEEELSIDKFHVIVDRKDLDETINVFKKIEERITICKKMKMKYKARARISKFDRYELYEGIISLNTEQIVLESILSGKGFCL